MSMSRVSCCAAMTLLGLAACIKRSERITVLADGSALLQTTIEGDAPDVRNGDSLPEAAAGWAVDEKSEVDQDGREDLVAAVREGGVLVFRRSSGNPPKWETQEIPMPSETGTGKGAGIADVNGDGQPDLVITCENAARKSGVFWLSREKSASFDQAKWTAHEISGKLEGVKYDLVQLLDLDNDGDLDALTCEERDNLGVIWYENPSKIIPMTKHQ